MKTSLFTTLILIFGSLSFIFCSDDINSEPNIARTTDSTTVSDFEGNIYSTIKIGNQVWTAENFKSIYTPTGDELNGVYAYDNNENNVDEYGKLYSWQSAIDACPDGWHLPSNAEWDELISTLGSNAADKLKESGSSGFNAKMGGRLAGDSFGYIGELGTHWTSTKTDNDHATQKLIALSESEVITDNTLINGGLSVRYIKNLETGILDHAEKYKTTIHETPFELLQNSPNPFNETTFFSFKIKEEGNISLKVYDIFGKDIAIIINDEFYEKGEFLKSFNNLHFNLSPGVYFISLSGKDIQQTRKIVIN